MLSRRIVLTSALGTAAAATLAACASGGNETAGPSPSETADNQPAEQPSTIVIGPANGVPVGGGAKFRAGDMKS
jgi:hypothetical protein